MATKSTKNGNEFNVFAGFTPDAFKESYEKLTDGVRDFADFQRETAEALMSSAGVYAKALEKAASEHTAFAKESYEDGAAAVKSVTTASSVQEAFEIQGDFVKTAFDKNISFATKIADHWTGVAKEASDPIAKQYGELVERVQTFRP